jgi:catechol 2,3-dioxygenase-like lactoylglutathione lyase family enzyme
MFVGNYRSQPGWDGFEVKPEPSVPAATGMFEQHEQWERLGLRPVWRPHRNANKADWMTIDFNHTIVWARDSRASAKFLADVLGLQAPRRLGPFLVVTADNGANFDFMNAEGEIAPQHYAFLVSESEFDEIFGRVRARSLPYWADPAQMQPGEINHHDDGRGFYFKDPDGHFLEVITLPYGSGGHNP